MTDTNDVGRLRLLAIGIAAVVWLWVSFVPRWQEQNAALKEGSLTVAVDYNQPADRRISILNIDTVSSVSLQLRAREEVLQSVRRDLPSVRIDLAKLDLDFSQGERTSEYSLSTDDITNLPSGVQVVSMIPERLALTLDLEVERRLPVQVQTQGEPSAAAIVDRTWAEPAEVTVRGPRSRVERATVTAPISINLKAFDTQENVAVQTSDPLVQVVLPKTVVAHVSFRDVIGASNPTSPTTTPSAQ